MGNAVNLGDDWQITVLKVVPDATDVILKENMFNEPPKAGHQFFLATVAVKYIGSGSATFGGSYILRAVGPSSVSYSNFENYPGVIPDPLPNSEVFTGGVITGNVGWDIISSDANALVMYDKPISFGSEGNRVFMALYTFLRQEKYDEAIKAFDEAIRLDPKLALAWYNKGVALSVQGKYDDAIKCFDEAIRLDPKLAAAWNTKGLTLYYQGKYDEAVKAYDEAIELDPKFASAWYDKGNALKLLGRTTEADVAFAKAKELGYTG